MHKVLKCRRCESASRHSGKSLHCHTVGGRISGTELDKLWTDLHFFFVLSHLAAIESPQHLKKGHRKRASQQAFSVLQQNLSAPLCCLCTIMTDIWKAACLQSPPSVVVHLHHCASWYISSLLSSPRGKKRATFGLSQGQVMISDPISPKHMACPGKLSQSPKIW